ncbi:MAG: DUF3105 domain-containing protein [Polyangiaceae bacterium]
MKRPNDAKAHFRPVPSPSAPVTAFVVAATTALSTGCGTSTGGEADAGMDAVSDASACYQVAPGAFEGSKDVAGACAIRVEAPPVMNALHISVGKPLVCHSKPPSSGPHYPVWAKYRTHDKPVEPGYYVHNLEHGSIVFLHKCVAPDTCADTVKALEAVVASLPADPTCVPPIHARTLIVPDPNLETPIVALAWGFIYRADCVDAPSLVAFANEHYAKGPENLCADGQDF